MIPKAISRTVVILTYVAVVSAYLYSFPFMKIINSYDSSSAVVQYVQEDIIFEGNGVEVMWRGAGGSYLFHTEDYILAWDKHLPEIDKMKVNTIRLAFRFPDSSPGENGYIAADTLDYTKLDAVLNWLDQQSISAILDCHNCEDMFRDFGSQRLVENWVKLAGYFRGDPRIAAYELFNEPNWHTWAPSIRSKTDVLQAYVNLTMAIREVDPDHIVIWQSSDYLPSIQEIKQNLLPNVVFTVHRWFGNLQKDGALLEIFDPEQVSYASLAYLVEMRERLSVPFWLGEFGAHAPFKSSNPELLVVEQLLNRCEERIIGWNLWMGRLNETVQWDDYLSLFPIVKLDFDLTKNPRAVWFANSIKLTDFTIDHNGVDRFEPYIIQLWHGDDYVVLAPGAQFTLMESQKLQNGSYSVTSVQNLYLTHRSKIQNSEEQTLILVSISS